MENLFAKNHEVAPNEVWEHSGNSYKETMGQLDRPLSKDVDCSGLGIKYSSATDKLDKPLNNKESTDTKQAETGKTEKTERMENQITIVFKCPEGVDRKEFERQLKGQERGLNSQTLAENMDNRANYERRKDETGNPHDTPESKRAQRIAREKAEHNRIEHNQEQGMSYADAKAEAQSWLKTQAALHNPDQIAGGDPGKVSRMGDRSVNSSIGGQWKNRVSELANGIDEYAKGKTREELEHTKLNVKLIVA